MYKWYDSLKEPKRFLVFFIPAALLIVGVYEGPNLTVKIISGSLLLLALFTRMFYIESGKRK